MSEVLVERPGSHDATIDAVRLRRWLLAWYRRRRRDLPWRRTRDPYRIWVSEIMLQQTQVATAVPFYQTFIARFPTVSDLARARSEDVLSVWAGLGYYRRARHLHDASRLVVREHAGRVPSDPDAFRKLPGVGRYTTGAVLSIGFDKPLPVLDGNVARVLSRLFAMNAAVRDPGGAKRLWSLAASLVPARRPGDWNQALMELGATVCTPRAPACDSCPVRTLCRARRSGRVGCYPRVPERRAAKRLRKAVVLIERRGRWLMQKREGRLLGGLWEPPAVELAAREGEAVARAGLTAALESIGVRVRLERTGEVARHLLSHRDIRADVWRGTVIDAIARSSAYRFVTPTAPEVPVTGLVRAILKTQAKRARA